MDNLNDNTLGLALGHGRSRRETVLQVAMGAMGQDGTKTHIANLKDVVQTDDARVVQGGMDAVFTDGVSHVTGFFGFRPVWVELVDFTGHVTTFLQIIRLSINEIKSSCLRV